MSKPRRAKLCVQRCARGHGTLSVVLSYGDGSCEKLVRSRCCGAWVTVQEWTLTDEDFVEIVEMFRKEKTRQRRREARAKRKSEQQHARSACEGTA